MVCSFVYIAVCSQQYILSCIGLVNFRVNKSVTIQNTCHSAHRSLHVWQNTYIPKLKHGRFAKVGKWHSLQADGTISQVKDVYFLPSSYGVCEAYMGGVTLCNSVFRAGVDLVYIPYTRTRGDQRLLSSYMNDSNSFVSPLMQERCREVTIKLLCNYYLIPCGNSSVFQPPVSVCSEQCFHLRNDLCPNEWEQVLAFFRSNPELVALGLGFIECNNTGLILEPLPHCCTDAGITLRKCLL